MPPRKDFEKLDHERTSAGRYFGGAPFLEVPVLAERHTHPGSVENAVWAGNAGTGEVSLQISDKSALGIRGGGAWRFG